MLSSYEGGFFNSLVHCRGIVLSENCIQGMGCLGWQSKTAANVLSSSIFLLTNQHMLSGCTQHTFDYAAKHQIESRI